METTPDLQAPALLAAMPQIQDPFFAQSVILLIDHQPEGSFGLIINRATELTVQEVLDGLEIEWNGGAATRTHFGGPVQPQMGTVLFDSAADEWLAAFSPDAKWVAYSSAQSGLAPEIYVRAFPSGDKAYLVSAGGGEDAMWSGDGRELFYRQDDEMWSVKLSFEPEFRAERPELLFQGPYLQTHGRSHAFDPHSDRFILVKQVEEKTPGTV